MKVLVTGATGFLGSYIVDKCIGKGDTVRVLVRKTSNLDYLKKYPKLEYVYGDLTDAVSLNEAVKGIDAVIHSAARVTDVGDRRQFYDENVTATKHLVEAAKKNGVKHFVFVSSPSIFFDFKEQNNINESYPYPKKYINLYSETKAAAEQLVLASNDKSFMTCALRPRAIWGPRDKTGFMPKILYALYREKFPDISEGKIVYASFTYAENAAEACVLAAHSDKVGGKAYFISDGEAVDSWGFLNEVSKAFNIPPIKKKLNPKVAMFLAAVFDFIWKIPALARKSAAPISRYAVGLLIYNSTYDISAAKKDFGYNPKIKQSDAIKKLKQWVDEIGGFDRFVEYVKK